MERGKGNLPALKEIESEFGLKTTAIVTLDDIFGYLKSGAGEKHLKLDPGVVGRLEAYRKEYGAG
jgi:orotate phosphoribosyltransferase